MLKMSLRGRSWIGFSQARRALAPLEAKYLFYSTTSPAEVRLREDMRIACLLASLFQGAPQTINIALLTERGGCALVRGALTYLRYQTRRSTCPRQTKAQPLPTF